MINQNEDKTIQGYSVRYIRTCIEKNIDTYIMRFNNLPEHQFNWCAAFFGTTWGGYRLMYKYSFIYWAVEWLISTMMYAIVGGIGSKLFDVDTLYQLLMVTAIALQIIFFVIRGVYADELYWKFLREKIDYVKSHNSSQEPYDIEADLMRYTGTSLGGVFLMYFGMDIANALYVSFVMVPFLAFVLLLLS